MGNWFGELQLAYKYTIVFVSLLVFTLLAGFIKVLFDRRKMNKLVAKQESEEEGPREDQVELNQREKDEGDLFGVRAIEAGFYAGIPQSRPTSRAGSVIDSPSMSSTTLLGGANSPMLKPTSMASSSASLPLAHANDINRDSQTLPSNSPPRRPAPPAIKLRPSEAEVSGRINHNAAVNMNLAVPPSPVLTRGPGSPTFSDGDSDGQRSPRSPSPQHYAPVPPRLPIPDGLRAEYHAVENPAKSQAASLNDSPGHSAPGSPGYPPESKLPSLPAKANRYESRAASPTNVEPARPSSTYQLQPATYQPTMHQRDPSGTSSVYSEKRKSSYQSHERSESKDSSHSYNYSFPEHSSRNSLALNPSTSNDRRPSTSSSHLAPNQSNDPRLSEFYDAYYRQSHLGQPQKSEQGKRPRDLSLSQPTIVEVDSPLPSPHPQVRNEPGMAM